ncbi:hypothetical protein Q4566_16865, partial [Tamlana sp. 2_MG-2023]|uniref:hypothetical protein n=1 Tax=unclassified Tamlana TaxID=2614803 RepID=UPI0026E34CFE
MLYFLSRRTNNNTGQFYRHFPPHYLTKLTTKPLNGATAYITGVDRETLYIGYSNTPFTFSHYQWDKNQIKTDSIDIKSPRPIAWKALKSQCFNNKLYFFEGITPNIFEHDLDTKKIIRTNFGNTPFTNLLAVSPSHFLLKTYAPELKQQVIANFTLPSKKLDIPSINLVKQIDGFFCTDGELKFNKANNLVLYTYRYRNEFLVFDSNLKLLSVQNTIDSNAKAKLHVESIKDQGKETLKLASPPYIVNKKTYTNDNWLFVNSNIISKNESSESFNSKSVIDIYDLKSGNYKYSFYIPAYKGSKMKDFA